MKTLTQVGGLEPKPKRDLLMTDFEVVEVTDFPRYSYHVLLSYWCMLPCILLTCYTKLYWCMLTCYTGTYLLTVVEVSSRWLINTRILGLRIIHQ